MLGHVQTSNTTHIAAVMLGMLKSKGMCNVHGCTRVHVLHTVETAGGGGVAKLVGCASFASVFTVRSEMQNAQLFPRLSNENE
jgi:hypothetical protein